MSMTRGMICIGSATLAIAGGMALNMSTMGLAGTLTLQAFAAEGLKAMGGGISGNLAHSSVIGGYNALAKRLTNAANRGRLPENHDLVRALRRSQLDAMRFLVESYAQHAIADTDEYDENIARNFRSAARDFLDRASMAADKSDFFFGEHIDPLDSTTELSKGRDSLEAGHALVEWLWREGAEASLAELGEATAKRDVPLPLAFLDWYAGQYGPAGFTIAAQQFFAERLKTNDRVRTALFQSQLQAVGHGLQAALEKLSRIDAKIDAVQAKLAERFDVLDEKINQLLARQDAGTAASLIDAMFRAVSHPEFRDELDRIFGAYCPHDEWQGSLASKDVADRVSALLYREEPSGVSMPAFFGREDQIGWLDDWLAERDRGLLVVCAPSGGGKSALLARWCERRLSLGNRLARHFASMRFPITTSPTGCLQHLLAQLREIDRHDRSDREAAIPSDEKELFNSLHSRLKQPAPSGTRLLVVIDAMDELDAPLRDCIVRSDLGSGNYVIVSRRAEEGLTPTDLSKWTSATLGEGHRAIRYDVPPMSGSDVNLWLEEYLGDVPASEMKQMAERLTKVTDGLPLFLEHVIRILIEQFSQGMPVSDRIATVMDLRDPFAGFLREFINGELAGVRDRLNRPFTQSELKLLAILTQTKGPISQTELAKVYEALAGLDTIDIANLDHRLTRWLSIRDAPAYAFDLSPRFAFDHSRLALEFSHVLGPETTGRAREALVKWTEKAWRPEPPSRFSKTAYRGANYAVRYTPYHLIDIDCIKDAARILTNMEFIRERFLSFPVGEASDLMNLDWARWGAAFDHNAIQR